MDDTVDDTKAMHAATALAAEALRDGAGGPFGAVVVRDGRILGRGRNRVLAGNDPTAHAEIEAIRDACRATGSHDLSGATLVATCEPCPMCRGAILWARLGRLLYAADRGDAAAAGFDDARFHEALCDGPGGELVVERKPSAGVLDVMRRWAARPGRVTY